MSWVNVIAGYYTIPMPDWTPLNDFDYSLPADQLAKKLIGSILIRRLGNRHLRARIVETEAYMGPADLASHSAKGRTRRTEVMFGPPGRAYVYLIYGMHHMLNIVAGKEGKAHAVLIRAAEPLDGWQADLSGPGKLARAMKITRVHNGLDLRDGEISVAIGSNQKLKIARTARIGVEYAKEWKHKPLPFLDSRSAAVSARAK